jgi:hypothetical protein
MSKSNDATKRETKFNKRFIKFGFDADGEPTHDPAAFRAFLKQEHEQQVARQRAVLAAD